MKKLKVGDIVHIKASFLNEPYLVAAYVYDEYNFGQGDGVTLITENGTDLGGFSAEEQEEYLVFQRESGYRYQFKNLIQLDNDFDTLIKPLFK